MSKNVRKITREPSRALFGQLDAFGRTRIKFLTSARPSVGQTNKFCPNEHPFFVKSWKKKFFTNSYSKIVFSCILRNFGPGRAGPGRGPHFWHGPGRAGAGQNFCRIFIPGTPYSFENQKIKGVAPVFKKRLRVQPLIFSLIKRLKALPFFKLRIIKIKGITSFFQHTKKLRA